jgi:hypothetical protein
VKAVVLTPYMDAGFALKKINLPPLVSDGFHLLGSLFTFMMYGSWAATDALNAPGIPHENV